MNSNGIGRLTGKVAIVTGAGSRGEVVGNGQATALLFAREGCKVLLVDSEEENLSRPIKNPIEMLGHVTSSYFSPTLKHSVAMALIKGGKRKIGSRLYVSTSDLNTIPVEVVETSFIDPKNERMLL